MQVENAKTTSRNVILHPVKTEERARMGSLNSLVNVQMVCTRIYISPQKVSQTCSCGKKHLIGCTKTKGIFKRWRFLTDVNQHFFH